MRLCKLDTLLLKQKNLPVLDITVVFPHSYSGDDIGAKHLGLHLSTHAEKETRYKDNNLSFRFSFIFRYFKVCQVSQTFTCGLSDLLLVAIGSLVVFVLQEYILKV
jgi:hypothetical protein